MDTMVSARVPAEIKKQGDCVLRGIDSSVTELVNSAYAYLLEHGRLPKEAAPAVAETPQTKTLAGTEAEAFREQWGKRVVFSDNAYDGGNFKELLGQARDEYHARLA